MTSILRLPFDTTVATWRSGSAAGSWNTGQIARSRRVRRASVLVAEDEALIGIMLEDMLAELDCTMVGPFTSLAAAAAAIDDSRFDVALIDFNLNGEEATPLARRLVGQGSPFAIVSGGGPEAEGHGEIATLGKPFQLDELASVLRKLAARASRR